jgi:futalosine hydrolase
MTRLLILVPTEFELKKLEPQIAQSMAAVDSLIRVCGFGPVAAGIQTTHLLAKHKPAAAVLIGIAGALGTQMAIGSAASFSRIGCYGVGAGSGSEFQTFSELGWSSERISPEQPIWGDVIELDNASPSSSPAPGMLLTVCSASDGSADIVHRRTRFPQAIAEDMEAYSVAMACGLSDIPLTVIRGISNVAGDRNKANWKIAAALEAAAACFNSQGFQ